MASFDENGKYIKTNWKAGDKITATKLNKIEESIEAVNDNDISRHVEADARLDALEAKDVAHDKELTNIKNTIADNKAAAELGDYDINSRMTFLENELNEGIEEVHNVASTVDGKIATAEANMTAQVNQGKADMEAMVAEVEADLEGLHAKDEELTSQLAQVEIKEDLPYVNIKDFGAIGDGISDDSSSIQSAIDYASSNNKKVFIPGKTYLLKNNIWLPSNIVIYGVNESSVLHFAEGFTIRTEKGGKRGYAPSTNYFYDNIPSNAGDCDVSLTSECVEGDFILNVNNTNLLNVGDFIYTFNNDKTSWAVLEDASQSAKWNDFKNYPMGQMEIFRITDLSSNTITLHKPLLFDLPADAPVHKLLGSTNIKLENFTIKTVNKQIHCEQIKDCVFENLNLIQTGITLDNKCYNNKIINNYIENDSGRCITICTFSSNNIVSGNTCIWKQNGDSVIIVMMANNNTISNNVVIGVDNTIQDRLGICIHARSYSNTVTGNIIENLNGGIGLYYGCYKNTVVANTCTNCLTDINAYYSNEAVISNITGYNSSIPKSGFVIRSILAFKCANINVANCSLNKTLYFEHSINCNISNSIIDVKNGAGICVLGDIKKSACTISNNTINSGTGIKIQHETFFDWEGFETINIIGNKINAVIGIDNIYAYYLNISNNILNCSSKGFNTVNGGSIQTIRDNKFMNSDIGICCNNNLEASAISCRDNTFSNVKTKVSGFMFPTNTTAVQIRAGVCGFRIYNLSKNIWTDEYCVYIGDTDGIQSNETWEWKS